MERLTYWQFFHFSSTISGLCWIILPGLVGSAEENVAVHVWLNRKHGDVTKHSNEPESAEEVVFCMADEWRPWRI